MWRKLCPLDLAEGPGVCLEDTSRRLNRDAVESAWAVQGGEAARPSGKRKADAAGSLPQLSSQASRARGRRCAWEGVYEAGKAGNEEEQSEG